MHMGAYRSNSQPPPWTHRALTTATNGHRTADRVAHAALTRAHTTRIPPEHVRQWLTRHHPETSRITRDENAWRAIVAGTRDRVAATRTPAGARELLTQLTRRLVTHVLTPFDQVDEALGVSARAVNAARAATGVVFVGVLRQVANPGRGQAAMDSALVTLPRLAVQLGCTVASARSAVRLATRLGWLAEVKRLPGSGVRYRLGRVRGDVNRGRMHALADLVDATVEHLTAGDGERPGPDVAALLSVDHPAWGYPTPRAAGQREATELDRPSWLILLADETTNETGHVVDPVRDLGLSDRLVARHRALLMRAGLYDDATSLVDALDEYAEGTGARARYETAEAARRAATEARLDALTVARERAKKARAAVRKALRAAQAEVGVTVPGPADPAELRPAWARLVHTELADVGPELRVAVRRELARRLAKAGHPDREARAVADRLAPDEPHPAAA